MLRNATPGPECCFIGDQFESIKLDLSKYKDEYHNELLKIIEAKAKGKRPTIKKLKPTATKSDDLYDQLMSSLQAKKGA